jgi:hypothetical protein
MIADLFAMTRQKACACAGFLHPSMGYGKIRYYEDSAQLHANDLPALLLLSLWRSL